MSYKNKLLFTIFCLLVSGKILFSQQEDKEFKLILPQQKVQNSFYNYIEVLDSRADTTHYGKVQYSGFSNKELKVICKKPLSVQLNDILKSVTGSSAENGSLLLNIRQIGFTELINTVVEKGYFHLRAGLYAKTENNYQKIAFIDTLVLVKGINVTNALLLKGGKTIIKFIIKNLSKVAENTSMYSYDDLVKIKSIEKKEIALYKINEFTDGLYRTYESFKKQVPDYKVEAKFRRDGKIINVKKIEANASKRVDPEEYYCLVHKGIPYIASKFGYYRLYKKDNDFYFSGKVKVDPDMQNAAQTSLFFGIKKALLADDDNTNFYIKIDYLTGGFIHLSKI